MIFLQIIDTSSPFFHTSIHRMQEESAVAKLSPKQHNLLHEHNILVWPQLWIESRHYTCFNSIPDGSSTALRYKHPPHFRTHKHLVTMFLDKTRFSEVQFLWQMPSISSLKANLVVRGELVRKAYLQANLLKRNSIIWILKYDDHKNQSDIIICSWEK